MANHIVAEMQGILGIKALNFALRQTAEYISTETLL
jgi:hypothetical protein